MYQEIDTTLALREIGAIKILDKIPHHIDTIEMSERDHAFLRSMLCLKKPRKILEIGVSTGRTTAVILETLAQINSNVEMFSVDVAAKWYKNAKNEQYDYDTGFLAKAAFSHLDMRRINHKFYIGNIVVHDLEEMGGDIDFVILDTVHRAPGEILDFIAILPFLKDGCVVLLHDTLLNLLNTGSQGAWATGLLFVSASGNKLVDAGNDKANIRGIEITQETRDNIKDVFFALFITWVYMPSAIQLRDYCDFICRYYPKEYALLLYECIDMQRYAADYRSKQDAEARQWNEKREADAAVIAEECATLRHTLEETRRLEEMSNAETKMRNEKMEADYTALTSEHDALQHATEAMQNSASFRVGRVITFLPRKLRDCFRRQ